MYSLVRNNPWKAVLTSALLLAAAYPPMPFPFLIWIAWVPLLLLLDTLPDTGPDDPIWLRIRRPFILVARILSFAFLRHKDSWTTIENHEVSRTRKGFRYYFVTFLIWNLLTCYWLMLTALKVPTDEAFTSFLAGFVASVLNPLFMSAPLLVWLKFHKRLPAFLSAILFIALWLSFEYLHLHWDLSWGWLSLGNSMSAAPQFIQFAEFTGSAGISLWILSINVLIWGAIKSKGMMRWALPVLALGIGIMPLGLNHWILNPDRDVFQAESYVNVRIVQPNIDPYVKFDSDDLDRQLNTFYRLAGAPGADSIQLVVFPETAIPEAVWTHEMSYNESMKGFWTLAAQYPQMSILTGFTELRYFEQPPYPVTARPTNGGWYDYCNSAVMLGSTRMRTYQKSLLVPMVERVPFLDYLSGLQDYNIDIGGGFGSYGVPDSVFNLYTRQDLPVGVMICYESAFPDHARTYTRKGARLLAVITNDGWWGQSSGYVQHAGLSVIRAIENRRAVVRSANTGISVFIDEKGNRSQDTPWWQETFIDAKVPVFNARTFYVQHGEYLSKAMLWLSLILCVSALFYTPKSRISESSIPDTI